MATRDLTLWMSSPEVTRDEVVPGLWQGDWPYPSDLTPFDCIVSATAEGKPPMPLTKDGAEHIFLPIHDWEIIDEGAIRDVSREVARRYARGEVILVHCAQGWNRSGVVVARALMFTGYTAEDAIAAVRRARGALALSNQWFVRWLRDEDQSARQVSVWG
jgi:hypothetical protein